MILKNEPGLAGSQIFLFILGFVGQLIILHNILEAVKTSEQEEKTYELKLNSDYYVVTATDLIKGRQKMTLREAQPLINEISIADQNPGE